MLASHFAEKGMPPGGISSLKSIEAGSHRAVARLSVAGKRTPTGERGGNGDRVERLSAAACWSPADFPLSAPTRALATVPMQSTPRSYRQAHQTMVLDYREQTLAIIERSILEQALRKTGGNKKAAAGMLRLKRTTLSAKMRSLDGSPCN